MQDGYIFENGNAVVEILKDNYGFAGIMFVDFVRDLGVEYISKMRKDFEAQIKEEAKKQGSVKEEKQILPMSLLLTADKLATDYIFDDGIYLDLPTMVSQLKDVNEVSEGQRAYETLIDYTNIYQGKFSSDNEYKPESWGFVKDGYLNIIPSIMRKIAKDENFSVKAFCSWADQKGLLDCNNKGKNQKVVRVGNDTKRFYSIKIVQEADKQDDPEFKDSAQEEIPFD
jgi:hypothetical protein